MPTTAVRHHVFLDWDDTLKVTNALYKAVSTDNAKLVQHELVGSNISLADIATLVHSIDLAKAQRIGLRPQHYSEAWVEAYRQLAQQHGVVVSETLAATLYEQAAAVPYMPQSSYPGATELLAFLRQMGYEITIWTAGETEIQEGKVERSGFRTLVDRVCVTRDKNVDTLRAALGERNYAHSCVIGNSPRSDIAPALELGMWAIHVLQDTWEYDVVTFNSNDPHYIPVQSLLEIPQVLQRVFQRFAS